MRAAFRITLLAPLVLVGVARAQSPAPAQTSTPELSGRWVLNTSKSDFGALPTPVGDTAVYTRVGSAYQVVETAASDTGMTHVTYSWPIGAGDVSSDLSDLEVTIQTRVTLRADTATFVSQLRHNGRAVEIETGREYLSPDGKTRTREFDLQSLVNPDEDVRHVVAVFERQ